MDFWIIVSWRSPCSLFSGKIKVIGNDFGGCQRPLGLWDRVFSRLRKWKGLWIAWLLENWSLVFSGFWGSLYRCSTFQLIGRSRLWWIRRVNWNLRFRGNKVSSFSLIILWREPVSKQVVKIQFFGFILTSLMQIHIISSILRYICSVVLKNWGLKRQFRFVIRECRWNFRWSRDDFILRYGIRNKLGISKRGFFLLYLCFLQNLMVQGSLCTPLTFRRRDIKMGFLSSYTEIHSNRIHLRDLHLLRITYPNCNFRRGNL